MKTSIIIPVYNEEKNILNVINEVKKLGFNKEIIIVDDGSKDKTVELVKKVKGIQLIQHKVNLGRGGAIKTGINIAKGDIICVLDGDMEHRPDSDIIKPILQDEADVVYCNRFNNLVGMTKTHFIGNKILSLVGSIIYGKKLNDIYTGLKCFKKEIIKNLNLESNGFEQEAELLAKLAKRKARIKEVDISYNYRKYGKSSMKLKDGFKGIFTMIKYYFFTS